MLVRLLFLLIIPASLYAQDSTAFRKGQWAAQFRAGSSFGSLGFLKFRSPTRALILDVGVGGGHREHLTTDSLGSRFTGLFSDAFVELRFGWRRYHGGSAKVASHYSLGLLGGFDHQVSTSPGGSISQNGWSAGVFADVGGTYLLTPKFGIGALGSASLAYFNALSEQRPSGAKVRIWQIAGSAVSASLVATLFF